jgi:hypothetical protein
MDKAVFRAVDRPERPATVLAALGPKMLKLSAEKADGAHRTSARRAHGQAGILAARPDPGRGADDRGSTPTGPGAGDGAQGMAVLSRAPNYVNNLKRFGFTDRTSPDGGSERLVDAIVATEHAAAGGGSGAHFDAGASHVCAQLLTAGRGGGTGGGVDRGAGRRRGRFTTSSPASPHLPVRRSGTIRREKSPVQYGSGRVRGRWRRHSCAPVLEVGDDLARRPAPRAARSGCPGRGRGTGASPASAAPRSGSEPGYVRTPTAELPHSTMKPRDAGWASSTVSGSSSTRRRSRRRWRGGGSARTCPARPSMR